MRLVQVAAGLLLAGALSGAGADTPAKKQARTAEHEYATARELIERGDLDSAIKHADQASSAVPSDVRYFSYAALLHQMRSTRDLSRARDLSRVGKTQEAASLLQEALTRDPDNPELAAAARVNGLALFPSSLPALVPDEPVYDPGPELEPTQPFAKRDFHLKGTSTQVLTDFMRVYGIAVQIDPGVPQRSVRFDVEKADFPTALAVLLRQTQAFLVPASSKLAVAYKDTPENRNMQERLYVQNFTIEDVGSPQALNEIINALRGVFSLRFVGQTQTGKLSIKAPRAQLDEVERFLEDASHSRPEMLLDINEIEISDTLMRQIGLAVPLQYQVLNVNTVLQQAGVSDINTLISQINSGTLSASSAQALSGILSQLQSQNAGLVTFGGGKSREAVVIPPATLTFNDQHNKSRILQHVSLRAAGGTTTDYHDGLRYPVVTTTFTTLVNSSVVSQLFGNQTLTIPPPAVEYVDLGLSLKFTPLVQKNRDIRMKFELQVKTLTGQNVNQAPVLGNREFSGTVNLREGETAVVAGITEQTNIRSGLGVPGLSSVGLGAIGGATTRNAQENQILITVTPRSLRLPAHHESLSSTSTLQQQQ